MVIVKNWLAVVVWLVSNVGRIMETSLVVHNWDVTDGPTFVAYSRRRINKLFLISGNRVCSSLRPYGWASNASNLYSLFQISRMFRHCFNSGLCAKVWHIRYTERSCDASRDQCSWLELASSLQHYTFFDLAPTKSIMDQAIGRLQRFLQQMAVVVTRLFGECWLDHSTTSEGVRWLSWLQSASSLQHYTLFRYAAEQIYCSSKHLTGR